MRERLYRNRYYICVYAPIADGETLLALCSDCREFAEATGTSYKSAVQILHYLWTGKTNRIRFAGRLCSVAFVDARE